MNIEAQPLGNEYRFGAKENDIVEVFDTFFGLRVIVSTWIDSINETLLEVYFRRVRGYRYLDERDLIAYWKAETFGPLIPLAIEPALAAAVEGCDGRTVTISPTPRRQKCGSCSFLLGLS